MMLYPFQVEPDGKFFLVTFPDVPEAITQGKTIEEAERAAPDALATALDFYLEQNESLASPSPIKRGQAFVELAAPYLAKSA